jgi:hypothetical protein
MTNLYKSQILIILLFATAGVKANQPNYDAIGKCLGIVAILSDKYGLSAINKRTEISKSVITKYSGKLEHILPKFGQCQQYYRSKNIPMPDSPNDVINQCGIKISKIDKEILIGYIFGVSATIANENLVAPGVDLVCFGGNGG